MTIGVEWFKLFGNGSLLRSDALSDYKTFESYAVKDSLSIFIWALIN